MMSKTAFGGEARECKRAVTFGNAMDAIRQCAAVTGDAGKLVHLLAPTELSRRK